MAGIDRDFWLDFAKDRVTNSIQSRDDAAEKLDNFLSFIWTIYTSIFALSSLLNYMSNDVRQLIFVSQPILIIMLARFFCKQVGMPTMSKNETADPNVVPEIIDSFKIIVEDKKRKLIIAIIFTIISMISICVALIGYNVFDPYKGTKQEIQLMKWKKELNDQMFVPRKTQQNTNDSLQLINDYNDKQYQEIIKMGKLKYLRSHNLKGLDSLKQFDK